jgi:hypothetical protein
MTLTKSHLKALSKDIRGGSEMVQFLILVIAVALFCLAAFKTFGAAVTAKTNEAAGKIPGIN